jgi:hypothetical protein
VIAILVDEIFRAAVVLVISDVVVVVVQQSVFVRAAVFVPVRFRLEPEHFHFVGIHGATKNKRNTVDGRPENVRGENRRPGMG